MLGNLCAQKLAGMLEGEEFMVLEIQASGKAENCLRQNSLAIDYLAMCDQKALTSPLMGYVTRLPIFVQVLPSPGLFPSHSILLIELHVPF